MPVEVVFDGLPVSLPGPQKGPVLEEQIVGRPSESVVEPSQNIAQYFSQALDLRWRDAAERTPVAFGKDRHLKWEAGSEWRKCQKIFVLCDHSLVHPEFLLQNVAVNASLLGSEITPGNHQFGLDCPRCYRKTH